MAGVLLKPRFAVSQFISTNKAQAPAVIVEMDDFNTAIILSRAQARKMAAGLLREADRPGPR